MITDKTIVEKYKELLKTYQEIVENQRKMNEINRGTIEQYEKIVKTYKDICKCALADLEGIMPEVEPSGERTHSAWKTIEELKEVVK